MHQYRKWVQILLLTLFFFLLSGFFSYSVLAEEVDDPVIEETLPQEQEELAAPEPEVLPQEESAQPEPEESTMKVQEQAKQDVSNFDSLKQAVQSAQADTPVVLTITDSFDWTERLMLSDNKHIELTSQSPMTLTKKNATAYFSIKNASLILSGQLKFDINNTSNGFDVSNNVYMEINDEVEIYNASKPAINMTGIDSNVVMNGGSIHDNSYYDTNGSSPYGRGAAVRMLVATAYNRTLGTSTFMMNGGSMYNNYANQAGGAVWIQGGAMFYMNGGVMENNSAGHNGGAVGTFDDWTNFVGTIEYSSKTGNHSYSGILYSQWPDYYPAGFVMNGGIIRNNSARNGGGIYVASNGCKILSGQILDNHASSQGGGVYVASVPYVLELSHVLITDNEGWVGGGLWSCPTGWVEITVTDGVAMFENRASGAGDDLVASVSAYSVWGNRPPITISQRMLGGGKNAWYRDGSLNRGDLAGPSSRSVRYVDDPTRALPSIDSYIYQLAIKSVPDQRAMDNANKYAKVIILGNSATYGGGIGTNGGIVLGTLEVKEISFTVKKTWISDTKPESIHVNLLDDQGQIVDEVDLNEENDWTFTFEGLDPNIQYSASEDTVKGYHLFSSNSTYDEDGNITYELINDVDKYGELKITKVVDSFDQNDYGVKYTFTIIFDSEGEFAYDGTYQGTIQSGDVIDLGHNEYIVIHGLPEGISYVVSEVAPQGFSVKETNAQGTIGDGTVQEVTFTNVKPQPPEEKEIKEKEREIPKPTPPTPAPPVVEEPTPEPTPKPTPTPTIPLPTPTPPKPVQPKGVQTSTSLGVMAHCMTMMVSGLVVVLRKGRKE